MASASVTENQSILWPTHEPNWPSNWLPASAESATAELITAESAGLLSDSTYVHHKERADFGESKMQQYLADVLASLWSHLDAGAASIVAAYCRFGFSGRLGPCRPGKGLFPPGGKVLAAMPDMTFLVAEPICSPFHPLAGINMWGGTSGSFAYRRVGGYDHVEASIDGRVLWWEFDKCSATVLDPIALTCMKYSSPEAGLVIRAESINAHVVVGGTKGLCVWNVGMGKPACQLSCGPVDMIIGLAGHRAICSTKEGAAYIFDLSGARAKLVNARILPAPRRAIFVPLADGRLLYSGLEHRQWSAWDPDTNAIQALDAPNMMIKGVSRTGIIVTAPPMAPLPRGLNHYVQGSKMAQLWETREGEVIVTPFGPQSFFSVWNPVINDYRLCVAANTPIQCAALADGRVFAFDTAGDARQVY